MSRKDEKLYDFLYLDFERVRSYSAQLFGGTTETLTNETRREGGLKAGIKLIDGEVSLYKSQQETKSLHHQLYLQVEKELIERGKVYFLNDINEETESAFIRFSSSLKLTDYKEICNKLTDIFDITQSLNKITKNTNQTNLQIGKKEIVGITNMIDKLYGNTVKLQYIKTGSVFAQTTLQPDLIQYGYKELITTQKNVIKKDWITLARVVQKAEIQSVTDDGSNSLSQIDEAISKLLEAVDQIEGIKGNESKFSLIPIAIYQEI